jgi:prepilin-type N-terminal cleavage/methylation domain-containing protein
MKYMASFPFPKSVRGCSHGFSLIEMMVVMAVSALLLGVATSFLWSVRSRDRLVRDESGRTMQSFRLAEALRDDIRGGVDVLESIDGPLVVMSPNGEQTRYELTPRGCVRSVVAPGVAEARRDEFAIGRAGGWNVERLPAGRRPLVAVALKHSGEPQNDDQPFIVYAALGADLPPAAPETGESSN